MATPPDDRATERVARLVGHVVASAPTSVPAPFGRRAFGARDVAPASGDEWPVIVMLESPAEDALAPADIERTFAEHELRVVWANGVADVSHATAVALVTVKKTITPELLDRFPALKMVAVAFTGYDHVDLEACRQRNIVVANVPGYSTDGVAELCFGLIFSLLRHIPLAHQHVRSGKWAWPPGNELAGKAIGVIGTGQIGMRVAEIGKAFKCSRVLGYDIERNPRFEQVGGQYVRSLASLFLHADILVVGVALTEKTRGLVSAKLLRLLRPDSILINCARGAIIDQEALTSLLQQGRFRAGLDVYEVEPLPADHPLRSIPENHLVTVPHLAYKCQESLCRRTDETLANILAFLSDSPQNLVSVARSK